MASTTAGSKRAFSEMNGELAMSSPLLQDRGVYIPSYTSRASSVSTSLNSINSPLAAGWCLPSLLMKLEITASVILTLFRL
jgi:hypothetical protein